MATHTILGGKAHDIGAKTAVSAPLPAKRKSSGKLYPKTRTFSGITAGSKGLYEPVNVTGMFGTASMTTQLAQIAYALSADNIEPFR